MKIRLHKAIADAGLASRRAAEEMIRQGRVAVNGQVVTVMGVTVDPKVDSITVDGNPLGKADRKRTYLFYKPIGVICTREDTHGRRTVFDILPDEVGTGLHSAGRLDMDAEGLLILTSDGDLTRTLTHPSSHLPKTYLVKVKGEVKLNALKKLRRGIELDDGLTLPASVSVVKGIGTERNTWLRIVLREGRKNQIKRMGEAVGHRVISIKRISIGGMKLPDKMKPGTFKKLSKKEIETLIGGRERPGQSPSAVANASRPASDYALRATTDKMADKTPKAQRERKVQSPKSNVQRERPVQSPESRVQSGEKGIRHGNLEKRGRGEKGPSAFANAYRPVSADKMPLEQKGRAGAGSRGTKAGETPKRKGWAAKKPKAKNSPRPIRRR